MIRYILPVLSCRSLRRYFYSGWAFLVPYFGCYAIYAWLKLPVNPVSDSTLDEAVAPSLLHLYWALHACHAILLLFTFVLWCREAVGRRLSLVKVIWQSAPWLCLALVVGIPGIYLEFPSDPIAHLGRIFEWNHAHLVTDHSAWQKASYFFAYSLIPTHNFARTGLTFYYTFFCLLLSWQHFRLARALDLGTPTALFFTAMQLILLGNSAFSFHRYYGLSSTIVSQIAVIALVRISVFYFTRSRPLSPPPYATVATLFALLFVILITHQQGILLAGVSLCGLLAWYLATEQPVTFKTIALIVVAVSLWISAGPLGGRLDLSLHMLEQAGWINSWGSFDLMSFDSPGQIRVREMSGFLGLLGLAGGLLMMFLRHPGGWLVTTPWVLLIVPATAFPLASYLHARGLENLSVFARQLMAVPCALPFAWAAEKLRHRSSSSAILIMAITLVLPLAMTGGGDYQNRLWQALSRTPNDLELTAVWESAARIRGVVNGGSEVKVVGPTGITYLLAQQGVVATPLARRLIGYPVLVASATSRNEIRKYLIEFSPVRDFAVAQILPSYFYSPGSQAAQASRHWLAQEAQLSTGYDPELACAVADRDFHPEPIASELLFSTNKQPASPQKNLHYHSAP